MGTRGQGAAERAAPSPGGGGANLLARLLERAARPESCAAIHFGSDGLQGVSWGALLERVRAVSEALVAGGVVPGERVALVAGPRLDACVADLGILGARGVTVACAGGEDGAIEDVLRSSGARVVFVGGDLAEVGRPACTRLLAAVGRVPTVEQIVTFDLPSDPAARVVSLGVLEARGRALAGTRPGGLEARIAEVGPRDLAAWLHDVAGERGGPPLTHHEVAALAGALPTDGVGARDDVVLLSLPLANARGRLVQAAWLERGFLLAFPRGAETTLEDAAMVGASLIAAQPRLLEELFVGVVAQGNALPGVQGRCFRWAMRQFDRYATARHEGGEADGLTWHLARRVLLGYCRAGLRARLGGRIRGFLAGGAPRSVRVALFFEACGLPLRDAHPVAQAGLLGQPTPRDRPVLE